MADLTIDVDFSDLNKAIKTVDQTKQSLKTLGSTFSSGANQSQYMRGINQIVNAQKQLPPALRMTRSEIMRLGEEYRQQARFSQQLARVNQQVAKSMQRNTRGINNMGVQMQQAGYQIGDFIVQVQSGTNAFVAFGQQATQVAGTLTLLGGKFVAIGSVLGILIPLATAFGAAWMRTRQEAEESIDSITEAMDGLLNKARDIRRQNLAETLGISSDQLLSAEAIDAQLKVIDDALENFQTTGLRERFSSFLFGGDLSSDFAQFVAGISQERDNLIASQEKLLALRQAQRDIEEDLARTQKENFNEEKRSLTQKIALYDAITMFGEDSRYVEELRHSQRVANLESEIQSMVASNEVTQKQADILKDLAVNALDAEENAEKLSGVLETLGGLDIPVTEKIFLLKQELGLAADEARNLVHSMPGGYVSSGRGRDPREFMGSGVGDRANTFGGSRYGSNRTSTGGGGGSRQSLQEVITQRAEQIRQQEQLLRLSGQALAQRKIEIELEKAYGREVTDSQQKTIEAYAKKFAAQEQSIEQLQRLKEQQQSLAQTIESSLEDGFMSIIDGTKSVEDAFKDMAKNIIAELYRVLVVQQLVGSVESGTGLAGMIGGFLTGGRASGGSVMSGGSYLVGEKGPEIFTPGRSGTIMNNNLSSQAMSGSQTVDVRVFVDDNGNFDAKVERISAGQITRAAPAIVNQSVGAVVERTKRGGSMKDTFR